MYPTYQVASTTDVHAPNSATDAVVTYAASSTGFAHIIAGVAYSYNATPTGGNLKIEDGSGNTIFSIDIPAAGAGQFYFTPAKQGTINRAMIITLASGGNGVTGKVSILGHWIRQPLNS